MTRVESITVLGSLSLKRTETIRSMTVNNDTLESLSMKIAMTPDPATIDNRVLEHQSLPIAGFQHQGGAWEDPRNIDYVTIYL